MIKIEDFDFDNVLIGEKLYKNIFIYNISQKKLIDSKLLGIRYNETDLFVTVEVYIQCHLEVENMIPFTAGLDVL